MLPLPPVFIETPISQLTRALTHQEASGDLAREIGFLPLRRLQAPQEITQGWRRFLDPGSHVAPSRPSQFHPAPPPRRPAA